MHDRFTTLIVIAWVVVMIAPLAYLEWREARKETSAATLFQAQPKE